MTSSPPRPGLIPALVPVPNPAIVSRPRHRRWLYLAFLAIVSSLVAEPWISRTVPVFGAEATTQFGGVAFSQGRFVAIVNNRLHHSTDGSTWSATAISDPSLRDLRVVNGRFYHALGDQIYSSPNGLIWEVNFTLPDQPLPAPGEAPPLFQQERWITSGNTAMVVRNRLLQNQQMTFSRVDIFRTSNLQTWESAGALPLTGPHSSVNVQSVVGASGRCLINYFVSEMTDEIGPSTSVTAITTDNGQTWTRVDLLGETAAVRLLYGNGWFLAVTDAGTIYRSNDGVNFTREPVGLPIGFDPHIHFGGGLFITRSTGETNTLVGSVEGRHWQDLGTLPFPRINALSGVAYGAGQFVALGLGYLNVHQTMHPFLITSAQSAPAIVRQHPASIRLAVSRRLKLSVTLEDSALGVTYRWLKNGVVLNGATAATLTIDKVAAADAGSYRVLITNAKGSVASEAADVTVLSPAQGSRLVNLSVNAINGSNGEPINAGFVVQGEATKSVIVRGIGPTLAQFNVPGVLADPNLTLISGGTVRAYNDNWTQFDGSATGGFPLPVGSFDAVIPADLGPAPYSVVVDSADHGVGRVLIEVYDAEAEGSETRLANLSARAHVSPDGVLVVGFVIAGEHDLPILLRGIGPSLAPFGIAAPLNNPRLTLFDRVGTPLATNDYWADDDGRAIGAFPLPVGSSDAVIRMTLAPGIYTAHVTSAIPATGTGTALLEIYDAL